MRRVLYLNIVSTLLIFFSEFSTSKPLKLMANPFQTLPDPCRALCRAGNQTQDMKNQWEVREMHQSDCASMTDAPYNIEDATWLSHRCHRCWIWMCPILYNKVRWWTKYISTNTTYPVNKVPAIRDQPLPSLPTKSPEMKCQNLSTLHSYSYSQGIP